MYMYIYITEAHKGILSFHAFHSDLKQWRLEKNMLKRFSAETRMGTD